MAGQITNFKPHKIGLGKLMGDLEAEIMCIGWRKKRVSVREVYELLEKKQAYTTVMTIMGRLHEKGLLQKEAVGKAFIYTPTMPWEEFSNIVVTEILTGLCELFGYQVIYNIVSIHEHHSKEKF